MLKENKLKKLTKHVAEILNLDTSIMGNIRVMYDISGLDEDKDVSARIYFPTIGDFYEDSIGYTWEFLEPLSKICKEKKISYKIGIDHERKLHVKLYV
jgi:hypothetical protein